MATKTILFLCTGNYHRSRFAEILFNSVAANMGLPWRAQSRALALERGAGNIGPLSAYVVKHLHERGIRTPEMERLPLAVTPADLEQAQRIIALQDAEHRPLVLERFPMWAERIEYWDIEDVEWAIIPIEQMVMNLTARLIGGRPSPPEKPVAKPLPVVKVSRETKGRRGKGVTIVSDVPLNEAGLQELAAKLKQRRGCGGTVKDGHIEIQGDQRDRLVTELERLGYKVKRAGG